MNYHHLSIRRAQLYTEILCGWIKLSRDRSANWQECEYGIKGDTAELHAYV